jgi:succinoglycan biosynthesis protein ExoM
MNANRKHICVCICTYKRLALLTHLLNELACQETDGLFTFSVVVADNDRLRSAEAVASEFSAVSGVPVVYCVEPTQNIALTRNMAVQHARGDFVAFIDDDEFPTKRWLLTLFNACDHYGVDGVLGPVKPYFAEAAPKWVVTGKFYDRPSYPTGFVIDWRKGRTGNVLLKQALFADGLAPFRAEFLTGEDQDFFRRMIADGHKFIWCHEAIAYEEVPPVRWTRTFMLRRALFRGAVSLRHPTTGIRAIAKSAVAAPAYAVALPFAAILGQGKFMVCLIKLCDHLGRLLAVAGINLIREAYVTE